MIPHADQKYIDALVGKEIHLVEEIYQKFSRKIKLMILQYGGTEADAADIFQEVLLAIYNKAKTGNLILTCPLEAFLYLVCKNKWFKELRKRKVWGVTMAYSEGSTDANTSGESIKDVEVLRLLEERENLLAEKTKELGEGCRELLRLSRSGKSMEEVASVLNVTYGYVRKKKSECVAKLMALVRNSSNFKSLKW